MEKQKKKNEQKITYEISDCILGRDSAGILKNLL